MEKAKKRNLVLVLGILTFGGEMWSFGSGEVVGVIVFGGILIVLALVAIRLGGV